MKTAKGHFQIAGWDERTYRELDHGGKLTQASVTQTLDGDIVGDGAVEWLMCYGADGTARFVGLQHLAGTLDGRQGSFVLDLVGDFDGKEATGTWSVVPGSGTGELDGLTGEGRFHAPPGHGAEFELRYELP